MRAFATILFTFLVTITANAQTPGDTLTMYFDDANDSLHLDSIYPAGCWQVGHPNKPVFTSAYSEPNALVTDKVLPHSSFTTCYAEFTSQVAASDGLGRWLSFVHRMDMDTLQSIGWLEVREPFDSSWSRVGGYGLNLYVMNTVIDAITTDTGLVFTGRNGQMTQVEIELSCGIVVISEGGGERAGDQNLHFRFGFRGNGNPNSRDGWLIDNVRLKTEDCSGGIHEYRRIDLNTFPNPANTSITLDPGLRQGEHYILELVRADGDLILREQHRNTGTQTLDLSRVSDGPYLLRVITETRQASERVIVEH